MTMDNVPWVWSNCRQFSIGLRVWLWPFAFGLWKEEDVYGGERHIFIGPFHLLMSYSIGNCSAEHWWERVGALSEAEAFDRAVLRTKPPTP